MVVLIPQGQHVHGNSVRRGGPGRLLQVAGRLVALANKQYPDRRVRRRNGQGHLKPVGQFALLAVQGGVPLVNLGVPRRQFGNVRRLGDVNDGQLIARILILQGFRQIIQAGLLKGRRNRLAAVDDRDDGQAAFFPGENRAGEQGHQENNKQATQDHRKQPSYRTQRREMPQPEPNNRRQKDQS